MNVKEDHSKLSAIARQGSGSACRSLYCGFAKWIMGKEENGNDSIAIQLADEKHLDDLVIIIAVVAFTFDAGPNAVLISHNRKAAALLLQKLPFYFPPQSDADLNSYVIGDKTILKDAGIQGCGSFGSTSRN